MKETETRPLFVVLLTIIVAFLVVVAGQNVIRMRQVARDSAHSALWHEINEQLKAREVTGEFPARLEELPLTYPDNGSSEMLKLMDYSRVGTGCQVSTMLRGKKLERRYGPPPEE